MRTRVGIHLGEVVVDTRPQAGKTLDLYGLQVDIAAHVMSLAEAGQILRTRAVFDNARQVLKGQDMAGTAPLVWLNHGPLQTQADPAHAKYAGAPVRVGFARRLSTRAKLDIAAQVADALDAALREEAENTLHLANISLSDAFVFKANHALGQKNFLHAMVYLVAARERAWTPRVQAAVLAIPDPIMVFRGSLRGEIAAGRKPLSGEFALPAVKALALSPDGNTFAVGNSEGRAILHSFHDLTRGAVLESEELSCLTAIFSPDGSLLASGREAALLKKCPSAPTLPVPIDPAAAQGRRAHLKAGCDAHRGK